MRSSNRSNSLKVRILSCKNNRSPQLVYPSLSRKVDFCPKSRKEVNSSWTIRSTNLWQSALMTLTTNFSSWTSLWHLAKKSGSFARKWDKCVKKWQCGPKSWCSKSRNLVLSNPKLSQTSIELAWSTYARLEKFTFCWSIRRAVLLRLMREQTIFLTKWRWF